MFEFRIEFDSLGEVKVPKERYWGSQTQRSIENFPFESSGKLKFPCEFIHALGIVKYACAEANKKLGLVSENIADLILKAAKEVIDGKFVDEFPLVIWQTGSGTQTNMNINEVIANRAIELAGGEIGSKIPVHPNDHVNKCQSSNDVIPSAMHISAVNQIVYRLIPALKNLFKALTEKQDEYKDIVKTGRTHLQDATPVTLGQEFSGYATQIKKDITRLENSLSNLYELALGGTAVGTGINSHPDFAELVANYIADFTGLPFITSSNKFEGIAAHDAIVEVSGVLRVIAVSMMKIANDIRWMGSGPRNGIGELLLPINEPGSSIMPGKVNPTQAESVTQVVAQVIGNDVTIGFAGSQGNFELNVFKPVMIYSLLQSINILTDASKNFTNLCIKGIKVNYERIREGLENNLMLATKLSPIIGYEEAAKIALEANETGKTIKEVILEKKILKKEEIDKILDPSKMISP
ncbi:MAG: class II fumarate hydratase [Candidatus Hodarchaeota archaeon]